MTKFNKAMALSSKLQKYGEEYSPIDLLNLLRNELIMVSYYQWEKDDAVCFKRALDNLHTIVMKYEAISKYE